ncbi:MAG TPA: type II toxin-antitoxin system VapC family toxin [Acidobacteriaceae bacterium]|nr:type II toxin-antitoxin system VapC family toxin [Acidobacteriaceae bacterium]
MKTSLDLLLDTHIWVRFINGDPALPQSIVDAVETARLRGAVHVSVISVWEVALLVKRARLNLPLGVELWVEGALKLNGIDLLPLTPAIAIETVALPTPMHKDPADRTLVASARIERLRLVTLDGEILSFARDTNLPVLTA